MEMIPICSHCGCMLILFEHYDCYDDADKALFFANGYCPQCQRKYCWTDVYTLTGIEDLEEVNKDERILD